MLHKNKKPELDEVGAFENLPREHLPEKRHADRAEDRDGEGI